MGYIFSPVQIIEMSMQVEKAGMEFYKYLSGKCKDETVSQIFVFLHDQEMEHYKGFSKIASEIKKINLEYEYAIDVAQLIRQSIDRLKASVFEIQSSEVDAIDIRKSLEIAIRTEEEAVRIYSEMRESFVEKFHKVISAVIEEEKKHLVMLQNVKQKLPL